MTPVKQESKSLLAKLLATENITVQHTPGIKTAMFDLKTRVLLLPIWENVSNDLQDLLLGHETGHALDTPTEAYKKAYETIAKNVYGNRVGERTVGAVAGFLNVVEDARIDKRQKRRYPGLRRNYLNGYKELLDRDFFGTKKRDINSFNFIDRLNLYFKGGNVNLQLNFNPTEKGFLSRVDKLETFPETVTLTEEIFRYCKKQMEEESMTASSELGFGEDGGEDEEKEWDYAYNFGDDSGGDGSGEDEGEGSEGEDEPGSDSSEGEGKAGKKEVNEAEKEGKGQGAGKQGDKDEKSKSKKAKAGSNAGASDGEEIIPQSQTEKTYTEKMQTLVRNEKNQFVYVNMPDVDWKKAVNDYKVVLDSWKKAVGAAKHDDAWSFGSNKLEECRKLFTEWRLKEKETISFMVTEFERKKAASDYSRIQTSKTGVIDMNKIHSYKFNEDLFKRVTTIPKGKSHGFVMIIDWSGSMMGNLDDTVKQLLSLCLFCKQIQVPFEVYAFKDSHGADMPWKNRGINNCLKPGRIVLRNFLSSRMKTDEFNFAASVLWGIGKGHNMPIESLGGTPLSEAILLTPKVVNDFRNKHKLEIVNTIFLTDGDGNGFNTYLENETNPISGRSYGRRFFYNCAETGKTYELQLGGYSSHNLAPTLLQILKDKTQSNLVGFFLHDGGFSQVSRRFVMSGNAEYIRKAQAFWKENKYYPVKSEGYDEFYVIDANSMGETENTLTIGKNATVKSMTKAFSQFTSKKSVNRVLLRNFIQRISGEKVFGKRA